ncbi:small-conductance mechanosensitive channel [Labrenzia sp. MBR-25]|jgi:hypothetical protein
MTDLSHHFASDETSRHSEWLRQQRWFIKAREDQERRQREDDKFDNDMESLVSAALAATDEAIKEFTAKLDRYDEATVMALMENQRQLDEVNAHIEEMLNQAFVMPDGRRVFLTKDRTQAFDEFGNAVSSDELDFNDITPDKPTWEQWLDLAHQRDELTDERRDILEFQDKVDAAREKASSGKITEKELEELDDELAGAVPQSVRRHMPELADANDEPSLESGAQASLAPTNPQTRTGLPIIEPGMPG